MFTIRSIAAKHLLAKNTYSLGFGKKRKPTPSDLERYDVVVVGSNLGNIFTHHFDAVVGDKHKVFISYENPTISFTNERGIYEQGLIDKFNTSLSTRQIVSKNVGQSEYVGVDKFNPDKSEVVLKNGRTIKYENLVIAMGQKDNFQEIKGFDEAWFDETHPFYTNCDHPAWRTSVCKSYRTHLNFNGGEAIFYIPPGNFHGEIQNYNFLASKAMFDQQEATGKFTWQTSKFTVINPNKRFSKYLPKVDEYIKEQCAEKNINIETNLTLVEVRKNDNIAVFRTEAGERVERRYGHFYTLMPTTTHASLKAANLTDSTGFLDVCPTYLRHRTYDNIFGLGDVTNIQTTKSLFGGLSQVAVLRHNLERKLNGLSMNAKYDGYTQVKLFNSPSSIANIEHKYGGSEISFSTDKISSSLRYKLYTLTGKHDHEHLLKFKSWGPPYHKFKKTFSGDDGVPVSKAPQNLQPQKKVA